MDYMCGRSGESVPRSKPTETRQRKKTLATVIQAEVAPSTDELKRELEALRARVDDLERQLAAFTRTPVSASNGEHEQKWWATYNYALNGLLSASSRDARSSDHYRAYLHAADAANHAHGPRSEGAPENVAANATASVASIPQSSPPNDELIARQSRETAAGHH
jgi:hypothetical protein